MKRTPNPWLRRGLALLGVVLGALVLAELAPRPSAGPRADIAGTTLDGRSWSLAAQRGRPVLVNFFGVG